MGTLRLRYVSYLLRLWQVQEQEQLAWRASLQDASTGARCGFSDVEALIAFLRSETATPAWRDEPAASRPGCGANVESGSSSTDTGCKGSSP
jgi:hypothetical protein